MFRHDPAALLAATGAVVCAAMMLRTLGFG